VSINPIDYETIFESVKKTRRLMVLDVGTKAFGVGSEVVARVCEKLHGSLLAPPENIASADCPCPMATALTEAYYPTGDVIIKKLSTMFNAKIEAMPFNDFYKWHMPPNDNIDKLI